MRHSPKQSSCQGQTLLTVNHIADIIHQDRSMNTASFPLWTSCPKGLWRNQIPRH
ncbi:hypothetical protein [Paenibacillus sp. CMAA1364]